MTVKQIDAQQLQRWLASAEAVLVDVREPDEFSQWRIPQATSMPLTHIDQHLPALSNESRKIVFQCLKGKRGEMAVSSALAHFADKEIYNLSGGIEAWAQSGGAIIRNADSDSDKTVGIPMMRQVFIAAGGIIALCSLLALLDVKLGAFLAFVMGGGLVFSGVTGACGMAKILQKMPWNQR